MHDPRRGMNYPILHRLCAGRELANGDVKVAIDGIFRRPALGTVWIIVKQKSNTRGETEHWQSAGVRQAFAQRILRESGVVRHARNFVHELVLNVVEQRRPLGAQLGSCGGQQGITSPPDGLAVGRNPCAYEVSHGRGSRGIRRPLAPIGGIAKFAMHVVAALANEQTQRDKGLPQHFLVQDALKNCATAQVDVGLRWRVAGNPLRPLEVIVIVAPPTAQCNRRREPSAPTARTANSLLIVKSHRRHVGHHDRQKRTNIDPRFHRGSHAQQVNFVRQRLFVWSREADALEETLAVASVSLVGLACEFLAIQTKQGSGLSGEEVVVVVGPFGRSQWLWWVEIHKALDTHVAGAVQMDPAALRTSEELLRGTDKAKRVSKKYAGLPRRKHGTPRQIIHHFAFQSLRDDAILPGDGVNVKYNIAWNVLKCDGIMRR